MRCAQINRALGSWGWLALLVAVTSASQAAAVPTYFIVSEVPGLHVHQDSYVLPLTADADIAHARQLIALGPAAGKPMVFASIAPGGDGINGDYIPPDTRLWSWHVTQFLGFADAGIEILDGWPTEVEQNVDGWIHNTGGEVGFWNYTVTGELTSVPEPAALAPLTLASALACLRQRARR